jgi:hypothetical protein
MPESQVEGCGRLTGGGGLARIDVADDDHVDVHLFLTVARRRVSQEPIKIEFDVAMMLLQQCWWQIVVDSPHVDGIEFLSVCVWFGVFFGKKVESGEKRVSDDDSACGFDAEYLLRRVIARIKVCADRGEREKELEELVEGSKFCNGACARALLAPS